MARILDPLREPSRFLTIAYVIALSLIALLTYGSHQIMERALQAQTDKTVIVYTAGRERMLAQKIALYELSYERDGSLSKDKDEIQKSIFNFESGPPSSDAYQRRSRTVDEPGDARHLLQPAS